MMSIEDEWVYNSLRIENLMLKLKLMKVRKTLREWKKVKNGKVINRQYAIRCIEYDLGEIDDDNL